MRTSVVSISICVGHGLRSPRIPKMIRMIPAIGAMIGMGPRPSWPRVTAEVVAMSKNAPNPPVIIAIPIRSPQYAQELRVNTVIVLCLEYCTFIVVHIFMTEFQELTEEEIFKKEREFHLLMMKKMFLGLLLLLLYMVVYGVFLAVYLFGLMPMLTGVLKTVTYITVLAGAFLCFLPWFFVTMYVVFFFKGEGAPVPLSVLKERILAMNLADIPIVAQEKRGAILITWKYLDARWWSFFRKEGASQSYELLIKFNDEKKEVRLIDISKSLSWGVGAQDFQIRGQFFRGIIAEFAVGKQWGIQENFGVGKVFDYRFSSGTIKNPVANTILRSGWNIRMTVF